MRNKVITDGEVVSFACALGLVLVGFFIYAGGIVAETVGDVVSGISANGPTNAFTFRGDGRDSTAVQVWGTWDGASVSIEMRICASCPWVAMPNTSAQTDDFVLGRIATYVGSGVRLSVASAGASTDLSFAAAQ